MKCARIRELLMSDYTDGEADEKTRSGVLAHLAGCPACRRFRAELKRSAIEPFRPGRRHEVPEYLWERIRERVRKPVIRGASARISDGIYSFFRKLKPAFAFSTVALLILAVATFTRLNSTGRRAVDSYLAGQAEFMIELGDNNNGKRDSSANGSLGTSIEEFFLS